MKYIEAPNDVDSYEHSLFLAGGISGCRDWQQEMVDKLKHTNLTLINPRRENFPMGDLTEGKKQIAWEWTQLFNAENISFWFPMETLNPITLFELGSWSMTRKKLFVGCHPDYKRRFDVEVQLSLRRPDIEVVYDIDSLVTKIKEIDK